MTAPRTSPTGFVVWLTGLPAAGKTTLAIELEAVLEAHDLPVERLDGDDVRRRYWPTLGFDPSDRKENVERVARLASRLVSRPAAVIVSIISPYEDGRADARSLIERRAPFVEVHVATPLEECMRRDPKGLYARAAAGQIANLTGFSAPYEPPSAPELRLDTVGRRPEAVVETITSYLEARRLLGRR